MSSKKETAKEVCKKVEAQAANAYWKAVAPAMEGCKKVEAQALDVYKKAMATALEAYEKVK